MESPFITKIKTIYSDKGSVFHCLKKSENSFVNFGEIYLSSVKKDITKGWKKHNIMTLNLVVINGEILFNLTKNKKKIISFRINNTNKRYRLTVPPNWWMSFTGIDENNLLMNIADIEHDPDEVDTLELNHIKTK